MDFSPCDICLERKCLMPDGPGSCNCETCDKRDVCPRQLRPTIRITTRCTQECAHCCFECGPRRKERMAPSVAADVARFVKSNGVRRLNVMGGEFFFHPGWEEILGILAGSVGELAMRLVSNGDWAGNAKLRKRVVDFLAAHRSIYLALSKDEWHTNRQVETARKACGKAGSTDDTTRSSVLKRQRSTVCPLSKRSTSTAAASWWTSQHSRTPYVANHPRRSSSFPIRGCGTPPEVGHRQRRSARRSPARAPAGDRLRA